jgi:hypothetical protein
LLIARLVAEDAWGTSGVLHSSSIAGRFTASCLNRHHPSEARNYTARLSGDCDACLRMAEDLDKLSMANARDAFYKTETEELVTAHALKASP